MLATCEREIISPLSIGLILIPWGASVTRQNTSRLSKNNEQLSRILRYRYTGLLLATLPAFSMGTALAQDNSSNLPPVQVDAPKTRTTPKQTATATPSQNRRRTARTNRPPKPSAETAAAAPDDMEE